MLRTPKVEAKLKMGNLHIVKPKREMGKTHKLKPNLELVQNPHFLHYSFGVCNYNKSTAGILHNNVDELY